jgi:hypothetical protein
MGTFSADRLTLQNMKQFILLSAMLAFAILAKPQTVINLELPSQPNKLAVSAGNDVDILVGNATTLKASATGGTPSYWFEWSPSTGLSNTSADNPTATPGDSTMYIVMATDQRNCTAYDTVKVNVKTTTGLGITESNRLRVFPNPVQDYFGISLDTKEKYTTVSLFTIDGKEIWSKTVDSRSLANIRFETGGNGSIYLLKVVSGETLITKTLVVSQK